MITALPTPPQRSDPTNFPARADAFMSALPTFGIEANALQADVNAKQIVASDAATSATLSANSAAASAASAAVATNVTIWVSGTTYVVGDCRFSPTDFRTYRRKTNGAGTTDPMNDGTNWALISSFSSGSQIFTADGTFVPKAGASYYMIDLVGGGASGSAAVNAYASGGGGGERLQRIIPASSLTSNVNVVVGLGGASVNIDTSPWQITGNNGGDTSFGIFLIAHGGKKGSNVYSGGGGGGLATSNLGFGVGQMGVLGGQSDGSPAEWGGGGGGGCAVSTTNLARPGGDSMYGGGGGGASSTSGANASKGGGSGSFGSGNGGNIASAGADAVNLQVSGAGGGGGNQSLANSIGGNGGFPGGGGGGASGTVSGTSGKGGDGVVRVYWW